MASDGAFWRLKECRRDKNAYLRGLDRFVMGQFERSHRISRFPFIPTARTRLQSWDRFRVADNPSGILKHRASMSALPCSRQLRRSYTSYAKVGEAVGGIHRIF
jgi:hypothetical protein